MNDLRRSSCPLLDDVCGDCESTAIGKPLMGEKERPRKWIYIGCYGRTSIFTLLSLSSPSPEMFFRHPVGLGP
jgi:hypothetical protein